MAEKKPTPAQRRHLQAIGRGEFLRNGSSWVYGSYQGPARMNYVMACSLHDAGWIEAELLYLSGRTYRLVLTEAGRAARGAE